MKAQPVFTDSKELIDFINTVKFDTAGLVPAVVQDVENNEVLMVAWMNQESLRRTLESGQAWFYSRKRQALWLKGETSGNYQYVREVRLDCDGDTLLLKVDQVGVACHLGTRSCFSRLVGSSAPEKRTERIIADLYSLIKERQKTQPEGSYTVKLFQRGRGRIAQKVGEEAVEVVVAAMQDDHSELVEETADLIYHLLVLLVECGVSPEEIREKLAERRR
ncbi:MAG TPA: bifunctional phosphoribosyl-AMP cyclohydrolase/phosphoribosyl-ATP diphosphatase HisIE [Syntrophaceticus sp.]|jgi:phosphoribosyl-ATP pyrophosphohydrolase/phosphoribosyl-AMP cyclohydrolase|uniref:Histidine biosynthesis bifunctional protein HisIE n=1 Tax=Syntrophaceticus schinkii TaxID=499207 RepID=A0A0B7MP07_9FIRM|nr:bifunctional phosphoribosyl-AMP cyclohydrolase/phosphoribosyl-ATP diphosphatase HisIE [Syntrophaceticus schinkii]HHY30882.1 bifunctional phosphoribosyl-AMP cyclohydrolase/phosphoribosyl-ATP diphosphatase HisIE [Syntrophaceticus sp.]MDD2359611.1 bifunctional phosphoribosyl-AMP cyclohydrolase/phosphoribosyl-ATP diphosphatase HisIE [Syntrophaceticus schinkii]MDD4261136.1 bifunctional phosphoribosyl-AMP cyclohydrolase/phosphoribosyl-ATP diphosphatase HisIE [Syntrophaceticus schinkii]MDD4675175.1